jgi:hypothetical protein
VGTKPLRADSSLEEHLSHFLGELCVDWGFCSIPEEVWQRITTSQHLTADQFAHDVVTAEGFDVRYDDQWFNRIRLRFIDKFGTEARAENYS